ncbi:uncharacterized protein LOC117101642 [Anneissia japonica]|uniref:uncharacterized protein LOC117101642 n=1 Tax=Anneissia japonica TaxID=1529436 RepID=UPI00142564BC|nr:uncharacterized protein LOC117101642 [Anneissia japonica]
MMQDGACGKTAVLVVSIVALLAALCNTGVWLACAIEYCEIYENTNIDNEWEIAILWYTPPVIALVLMSVPMIFGICMGTMCYDSAVGIAIAVFSTLSVIASFAYICLELLALFGDKGDVYHDIFNRTLTMESDTGEWLWRIQLGLTCFIFVLTMCLIIIGYCSCTMIDEDQLEKTSEEEGIYPDDPNDGQSDMYRPPYMISKRSSPKSHQSDYGLKNGGLPNRHSRYNDDLIADHLRPRETEQTHHEHNWSRKPTYTTRQDQHAESMLNKYARYGARPAVGPAISRSSSTRRSQHEMQDYRDDSLPRGGGLDPGPPQEPYHFDGSESLYPVNQRQRRPKQNGNASVLDYGKKRSNYTGISDMRAQMTNGLPRPQVDYDYGQDNEGFRNNKYDYY